MGGVFISYRREDSGPYAGRLRDALSNRFGPDQIFRDLDRINPGERFPEVIERAVVSCDVLLAVIGPAWLTVRGKDGTRRLDDPDDYVRQEIAAALRRDDVLVIPVLIGSAPMPARDELPDDLADLADRNALRLSDELWDDQLARLIRALEPIVARAAPASPAARPLPSYSTTFVGREDDLREAQALLATTSLLTITGVGGVGKTRFAVELVKTVGPPSVWYAELAPVRDGSLVVQAVASAVGLTETPGRSLRDSLTQFLAARRGMLVIDNCEHVVDAVRELAEHLGGRCPELTILATSRQPLDAEGETVWPLAPLPEGESVQLFADRAAKAGSGFALTPDNQPAVAEVCRRLEGIPLAIQLAVAPLRALSVEELSARLRDWFLAGKDGPQSRQKTLYGAIDWSYQLLDDAERAVFARLAVFAGGCTLDAAEAIGGAGLDVLTGLVDRSLVVANRLPGGTRFRLLEPVREHALDRLVERREEREVRVAHARWFATLASRVGDRFSALDPEEANLRQALRFLLDGGDAVAALGLAADLAPFWFQRGRISEGRAWFEEALAKTPHAPPAERARALTRFSGFVRVADHQTALRAGEEGLAIARRVGDAALTANALRELAWVNWGLLRVDEARRQFEECVTLAHQAGEAALEGLALSGLADMLVASGDVRAGIDTQLRVLATVQAAGDEWETANAIALLGHWRTLAEEHDEGIALLEDALARFRAMSSPWGQGWVLCALGEPAIALGDLETAEQRYGQALELLTGRGMDEVAAWALAGLGHAALLRGDLVAARAHFVDLYRRRTDVYGSTADAAANVVPHLTDLFATEGRHELAARLLGAADAARAERRFPALYLKDRLAYERSREAVREGLGDERFARLHEQGARTPMEALLRELGEAVTASREGTSSGGR
jgi:predicted ATPase